LISNIGRVEILLAEHDLQHSDDSCELQLIKTLFKWLVLVNDCDVADTVQLVQTLNAVFNQLCQFDCTFDSVGHSLNDHIVRRAISSTKEFMSSLKVAANANSTLNTDLI